MDNTSAKLSNSYVFTEYITINRVNPIIQAVSVPENIINNKIELSYKNMTMGNSFPMLSKVVQLWEDNGVNLYYSHDPKYTVSGFVPMVLKQDSKVTNGVRVDIFIKQFTTVDLNSENNYKINPNTLYSLLETAYFFKALFTTPNKILSSQSIETTMMDFYVQMVFNLLLRDYAISVDPFVTSSVRYLLKKFFTNKIWVHTHLKEESLTKTLQLTEFDVVNLNNLYATINNIENVFTTFSVNYTILKDVTILKIINKIVNIYGAQSMLALDFLPNIFLMISSAYNRAYIVSQKSTEGISKQLPSMSKFYPDLLRTGI